VLWVGRDEVSASWVAAKNLSAEIISGFEDKKDIEVIVDKHVQNGQTQYTANVTERNVAGQAKRMKSDRWITPTTSGYIMAAEELHLYFILHVIIITIGH